MFATAQYNCLNSTNQKIQLYLIYPYDNSCDCSGVQTISQRITKLADEVNKLCNETVHTILLESGYSKCMSSIAHCGSSLDLTHRYKWGEIITGSNYCNTAEFWNSTTPPAVVVLNVFNINDALSINMSNCIPYTKITNRKPAMIKKIGISDTLEDKTINITHFVNSWKKVTMERESNFFIFQAFDTYDLFDAFIGLKFYPFGWWYLDKDPGTTNTMDFIFEEKINVAAKLDSEERLTLLPWHRNTSFNKNTTGIIFQSHFSNESHEIDFCRVMCIQELDDLDNIKNKANKMIAKCGDRFELILLITKLSNVDLTELYEQRKYITILKPVDRDDSLGWTAQTSYSKTIQTFGFKQGHYIDLDYCGQYNKLSTTFQKILVNVFTDPQSSIYIFHYEEYKDKVNLGATRMFRLRNTLFYLCKKLLFTFRNSSTAIGFAAKAIYKSNTFYNSTWAMKNYLKYTDLMSRWVEKQPGTVIFLGQDEDRSFDGDYKRTWNTVGWYSYNKFVENKGYKLTDNMSFDTPTTSSSDSKFVNLNNFHLSMIIGSILIFIISMALGSFCLVRRYKKKYLLSNQESELFFMGSPSENNSNEQDPNDMPYNQTTYELSESNFKVDTTELLGSGEFGMVCRGTIVISDEEIKVAVKSTNPQKPHKTALTGLLSEIKVLSHVGPHPNIIKLFGAHTTNIRTGKIYVFLELCHLGSLLSFLRKISLPILSSVPVSKTKDSGSEKDIKYVNMASGKNCLLDASLSNDLFRWSKEICNGMAYLAEKHVVHADLATRNVLLNLRHEAKICDFGLSRRMYNFESYVKSQQEPLPWKWMAPESLRYMQFNEKTDVWSYGILLWELYSLGSGPYAGLSWDANFVQLLEGGLVPAKPDFEEKNM